MSFALLTQKRHGTLLLHIFQWILYEDYNVQFKSIEILTEGSNDCVSVSSHSSLMYNILYYVYICTYKLHWDPSQQITYVFHGSDGH